MISQLAPVPAILGPTAFTTIVWGAVALVLAVFAYVAYTLARPLVAGDR